MFTHYCEHCAEHTYFCEFDPALIAKVDNRSVNQLLGKVLSTPFNLVSGFLLQQKLGRTIYCTQCSLIQIFDKDYAEYTITSVSIDEIMDKSVKNKRMNKVIDAPYELRPYIYAAESDILSTQDSIYNVVMNRESTQIFSEWVEAFLTYSLKPTHSTEILTEYLQKREKKHPYKIHQHIETRVALAVLMKKSYPAGANKSGVYFKCKIK